MADVYLYTPILDNPYPPNTHRFYAYNFFTGYRDRKDGKWWVKMSWYHLLLAEARLQE